MNQEKIRKYWNETSQSYWQTQWMHSVVTRFDHGCTKSIILDKAGIKATDRVLEIGCGPGTWTKVIAPLCRELTSIDLSPKMACSASAKVKATHVTIKESGFEKFTDPKPFDRIIGIRVFEYIPKKAQALRKALSMLKPGGRLFLITKTTPNIWDSVYGTTRKKDFWRKAVQERQSHWQSLKLLEDAGFTNIEVYPVIIRLPVFASGNKEVPLVAKGKEAEYLRMFSTLTRQARELSREQRLSSIGMSESYAITGTRPKSSG